MVLKQPHQRHSSDEKLRQKPPKPNQKNLETEDTEIGVNYYE